MRLTTLAARVLDLFGPEVRSWVEFHSGHHTFFYPWGTAMNGQTARLEMVRALLHSMQPVRIIETGTYHGTTTEWFAGFGVPVLSIEANQRAFRFAARRLARFTNVRVVRGDSVAELAKLRPEGAPVFCYLDAHWEAHLPLRDELRMLVERFPRAVVLIDDFAVPDDAGYAFDDYGPGAALTIDYLKGSSLPASARLFLPTVPSTEETGHRRGAAVVAWDPQLAELLAGMRGLRPWPLG